MRRGVGRLSLAVVFLIAGTVPAAATSPRPPTPVLRAELRQILAQPQYQPTGHDWWLELKLRLLRAATQWWLEHVTPWFTALYSDRPLVYWLVLAGTFLLLLLLLYHLYLSLRAVFDPGRRRRRSGPATSPATPPHAPEALLQAAEAAAAAGDYPRAYQHLYLALIRHLERRALVHYDPACTNRDYLRQLRDRPHLAARVELLTSAVEPVWYGYRPATPAAYARCRQWVQETWEEAATHGAR